MSPKRDLSNVSSKWPKNQKYLLDLEPIKYKIQKDKGTHMSNTLYYKTMHTLQKMLCKSSILGETVEK